ncbi:MAG: hypothetical protein J7604_07070 [Sporocytophaga sp.]|uniref:hypothetical protein n=1 Tax=Sporocytophaga sp. TaxID=2231183 RepID=UPI001B1CC49D|nr:hypothetical protein [Sporocytophaga sp.]MBO9699954.1 hypothetical protein [Sporocytophaga sp.]
MTYYHKDWNLYVANLLMKETIEDSNGSILNESFFILIELFQFENPEVAYLEIVRLIESNVYSDRYRDKGNIVELKCIGLNELDLLQTNIDDIKSKLRDKDSNGITITGIGIDKFNRMTSPSIKRKEELKLFDKYYNYRSDGEY